MRYFILISGMILALASSASGETYVVNPEGTGDFPTIQAAIDAVQDGDIIELTDGTFTGDGNRDIDYLGKAITVRSQSGNPATCVIDCQGISTERHRGFNFLSGEQAGSVLTGITVKNGWVTQPERGGAIRCRNASSPSISSCVFLRNQNSAIDCMDGSTLAIADCIFQHNRGDVGGGIFCNTSSLYLSHCHFFENAAEYDGGAMWCYGSYAEITNCTFDRNSAARSGAIDFDTCVTYIADCLFRSNSASFFVGAITLFHACTGTLERCTFAGNTAVSSASALGVEKVSTAHLKECTLWGNASNGATINGGEVAALLVLENTIIAFSTHGRAIVAHDDVELTCCDIYGNAGGDWVGSIAGQYGINGNICEDPLFCDPENENFCLMDISPCAPFCPPNPECDLIGAWPVGCGQDIVEHAAFPSRLYLGPSSPNPFSQATGIIYGIPGDLAGSRVLLNVLDLTGRLIRTLVDARQQPGRHSITWDATDHAGRPLEGGVYFYCLSGGGERATRRMLLVR